jgi:maleate cis-trans isomerase
VGSFDEYIISQKQASEKRTEILLYGSTSAFFMSGLEYHKRLKGQLLKPFAFYKCNMIDKALLK